MLFKTISPGIAWSTLEVHLGTLYLKLKGDAIIRLMKGSLIVLSADNYEISQVFSSEPSPPLSLTCLVCLPVFTNIRVHVCPLTPAYTHTPTHWFSLSI
jgi:hypothetical protein